MKMNIACLQMKVIIGDYEKNAAALKRMAGTAMAAADRPDVLVLPELWDIGFFPRPLEEHLAPDASDFLAALAKEYGVNIVGGSVAVKNDDGTIANACFIYGRDGAEIARYDKTHLFSPGREDKHFKKGDHRTTFKLGGVRCGVAVCYDLRFFELIGATCRGGEKDGLPPVDLFFLPTQWPEARGDHFNILIRTRAMENQVFFCACNASGAFSNGQPLCGQTAIIGPWGDFLAIEKTDEEAIVAATLDFDKLAEARKNLPISRDRRPELY